MRAFTAIFLSLLLTSTGSAATLVKEHKDHPYREDWKRKTYGKKALALVGVGVGTSQARNTPAVWGQGVSGLAKRAGFGLAGHAVKTTVEVAVAAPLHESLRYDHSESTEFGPRLRHALIRTVVAQNTHTGKNQIAAGQISGHAALGAFYALAVPAASGATTAGISLGAAAGTNVLREFWPKRPHADTKMTQR